MGRNLEILVGRPWEGLGGAYARGEASALRWFASDWRDPDAWRERARIVTARFDRAARERAVEALRAPTEEVRRALARVVDEQGFLVTTGQQPALFTGPLYTLHKALSAVALARWLEEVLDAPVTPVFWVASEDHDWAEVDHVDVIGVDNELHRIQLEPPAGAGNRPLHRLATGRDVETAVDRLFQLLPSTDFTPECLDLVRRAWRERVTLPDGVRATLEGLLAPYGIAFVDASDPALKAASRPVLEAEARSSAMHERGLAARAGELERAGWRVQVPVLEGGVNLFVEGGQGRERLYRQGDGFRLRHSGTPITLEALLAMIRDAPEQVSPNVLLRPVVEAATLPTVGYVAGPGETAYLAQLSPLFTSHGVPQPAVFPRLSATLVEAKIAKVLEKFSVEPAALARAPHELASELARGEVPEGVAWDLDEIREAIGRGTSALVGATGPVDPTLEGPIRHAQSVSLDAWSEAERKIVQAVKRNQDIALQQIEKARLHLFPNGVLQERQLSPFYYLARYGPALLDELLERFTQSLPVQDVARPMAPPRAQR